MAEIWNEALFSYFQQLRDRPRHGLVAVHPTYGQELAEQTDYDTYLDGFAQIWTSGEYPVRILVAGGPVDKTYMYYLDEPDITVDVFPDGRNRSGVIFDSMAVIGSTARRRRGWGNQPGCVDLVTQQLTDKGFAKKAKIIHSGTFYP